jgi:hypothetical protein
VLKKEKGSVFVGGIDSRQILNALAVQHKDDVFIPECKNGQSWGNDLLKLDAWVLKRTYSPLTTIGYEIKCSRQDFERDQKWTGYLGFCHYFYFVCPAGLIKAADLPPGVGLVWVSASGTLHTKHKATRMSNPDPTEMNKLLIYALMARSKIVANMYSRNEPEVDHLQGVRECVEKANAKKELAYFIKGHVQERSREISEKEGSILRREERISDFTRRLALLTKGSGMRLAF